MERSMYFGTRSLLTRSATSAENHAKSPSSPHRPTLLQHQPYGLSPWHQRLSRRRISFFSPPNLGPERAFWLILGLNVIPFVAWQYCRFVKSPISDKLHFWLEQNFTFSKSSFSERPWTILTSGFSHQDLFHIIFNMFTLNTCATILGAASNVSSVAFLGLQVAGIVGGNLASYYFMQRDKREGRRVGDNRRVMLADMKTHLGASGGVSACLVAASCFVPAAPIQVMFIPIGIPLAAFTGLYMLFDASMIGNAMSRIGHEAHVGGGIVGGLFFLLTRML